jgi:CheY-like chemotaxis protein
VYLLVSSVNGDFMASNVRILIADDHSVVRAGLKALLERQSHLRVIAEAGRRQKKR